MDPFYDGLFTLWHDNGTCWNNDLNPIIMEGSMDASYYDKCPKCGEMEFAVYDYLKLDWEAEKMAGQYYAKCYSCGHEATITL